MTSEVLVKDDSSKIGTESIDQYLTRNIVYSVKPQYDSKVTIGRHRSIPKTGLLNSTSPPPHPHTDPNTSLLIHSLVPNQPMSRITPCIIYSVTRSKRGYCILAVAGGIVKRARSLILLKKRSEVIGRLGS